MFSEYVNKARIIARDRSAPAPVERWSFKPSVLSHPSRVFIKDINAITALLESKIEQIGKFIAAIPVVGKLKKANTEG